MAASRFRVALRCSAVVILVMAGCGSPEDVDVGPVRSVPAPPGTFEDPFAGLPVTDSEARLLVSTIDDAEPLLLLDLAEGSITPVTGIQGGGLQRATFLDDGTIVVVDGPRSFAFLDRAGARRGQPIEAPATAAGEIVGLDVVGDALAVSTRVVAGPERREGRTSVHDLDGSLRCEGPDGELFLDWMGTDELWSDDLGSRLDLETCTVEPGLGVVSEPDPDAALGISFIEVQAFGGSAYVNTVDGVDRFDLTTGERVASYASTTDEQIGAMAVHGGAVWVVDGADVVRLDQRTLEEQSRSTVLDCVYFMVLVSWRRDLYLLDHCDGVLLRLDGADGHAVEGWQMPLEEGSDIEAGALATDEGIWIVDVEQTGEPYLFDPEEERFERLPITRADAADIYALEFDVDP